MNRRRMLALAASLAVTLGLFVPVASTLASSTSPRGYRTIANDMPTAVTSRRAQVIGQLPASTKLRIVMALRIRNWTALNNALMRASSLTSPTYGRYLTQAQGNRLFNPTVSQQNAVGGWLRSQGLKVTHTFPNHLLVGATAPVQTVERAFRVPILRYRGVLFGTRPTDFYAPSTAPSIPARFSRTVLTVLGLDNASRAHTDDIAPGRTRGGALRGQQEEGGNGYYPSDFRAAYNVPTTDTGSGQYIGITEWNAPPSNTTLASWGTTVSSAAPSSPSTLTLHNLGGPLTDDGETDLDVESSFGMAPGAHIDFWEAATSGDADLILALNGAGTTTGSTMDRQISRSWGGCEVSGETSGTETEDSTLASDSATGHAYFFSSGDTGSYCGAGNLGATSDDPYPQYPAGSPYVTAVGGTGFGNGGGSNTCANIPGNSISSYPGEQTWCYGATANTEAGQCGSTSPDVNPCPEGSGGGYSLDENRPAWQLKLGSYSTSLGACADAGALTNGCRAFPDVAAAGDPAFGGAAVETNSDPAGTVNPVGGTSLASPLWAGMLADINSYEAAHAGPFLGFPDTPFYEIANNEAGTSYANDFHDIGSACPAHVTPFTSNPIGCTNGAYNASASWDPVSGLGSPNVANLESDIQGHPTASPYLRLSVRISHSWTVMHWRSTERVIGFNVFSGKIKLNARLVVSHTNQYSFRIHMVVRKVRLVAIPLR